MTMSALGGSRLGGSFEGSTLGGRYNRKLIDQTINHKRPFICVYDFVLYLYR